jgi:hypothetical protein
VLSMATMQYGCFAAWNITAWLYAYPRANSPNVCCCSVYCALCVLQCCSPRQLLLLQQASCRREKTVCQ